MTEQSKRVEIDASKNLLTLAFSANGEHLVSGHWDDGVRVWQGKQCVATLKAKKVLCVAVSKDGQWIAAGTRNGEICVWNTNTCEQAFRLKKDDWAITGVDFLPDSTRFVTATLSAATVWDVNVQTCKELRTLEHDDWVYAAKYSSDGNRIATATKDRLRVWDSNGGTSLVDIAVGVVPQRNRGLVWSDDHLFVVSNDRIKKLGASTGSTVSEWQVPDSDSYSCIALPQHGQFIAYATNNTVTFWDTFSRSKIVQIQHSENIRYIVISPDDLSFAIGGENGKVIIDSPSRIIDSSHPTLQVPAIQIEATAFDAWQHDQLDSALGLLDTAIANSLVPSHHELATRALMRARLAKWDEALADAENVSSVRYTFTLTLTLAHTKAINVEPSVIGYIAKSIAHVGRGHRHEAYRSCDIAIERFHSDHVTFLLLVKSVIVFMAGERLDAISRVDDLIAVKPTSFFYVAYMLLLHGIILVECGNYEDAIQAFQRAQARWRPYRNQQLFLISLIFGWKFDNLDLTIRQRGCDALYLAGRTTAAGKSLLQLVGSFEKEVHTTEAIIKWVADFTRRYLTTPASDTMSSATRGVDGSMLRVSILKEWAKAALASRPWKDALASAVDFIVSMFAIYQAICERLDATEHINDAAECLQKMTNEISQETDQQAEWITVFKDRLSRKLEQGMGLWNDAIDDANRMISLDPSSSLGYERKYAASRGAGDHDDAEVAFETMLLRMSASPDTEIRERSRQYIKPTETEATIREAIQGAIRKSPLVLINTHSGRLLDKRGQASSFELQPIFHELVSSTTTRIDRSRIQDEVSHYYRYATFSHKWKEGEPSFEDVIKLVVYKLKQSPTHEKLQKFCEIVREAGFHWAWSDTCCINKSDSSVLQEALVSMFQWYQCSSLTIVLLCDVPLRRLFDSVWNSRAWTFQEYHASKVVRFYNQDWTLYKDLDTPNHKESPQIIAEMEEATGISAQALMALQPGLEDIREKLRLASARQATRIEDAAYSLLGIFSLSMSIEYGEGDKALGRLLAQLLASSGDTSILAWTGMSGGFNSGLPANITAFSQSAASHIPPAMTGADMDTATARLREESLDLASIIRFYDKLSELPEPHFMGKRMKLPSIVFKLDSLLASRNGSEYVFRTPTRVAIVEIKTDEDLSRFKSLVLVHPWIDFLLDKRPIGGGAETGHPPHGLILQENTEDQSTSTGASSWSLVPGITSAGPKTGTSRFPSSFRLFSRRSAPRSRSTPPLAYDTPSPPPTVLETDREMDALRVLARLKQPFGALLLTPDPRNVSAYRRVAASTPVTAQVVGEMTLTMLDKLIRNVEVLGVL